MKHGLFLRIAATVATLLFLISAKPPAARAQRAFEPLSGVYPPICSGFNPESNDWKRCGRSEENGDQLCPQGYAIMAHFPRGTYFGASDLNFEDLGGSCCPLPPGALSLERTFVSSVCPDDFVATGVRIELREKRRKAFLVCTKINTSRFRLGEFTPGWTFGSMVDPLQELAAKPWHVRARHTARSRIPAALRYGFTRLGPTTWDEAGCVGHPWGSLFTGREYIHCSGSVFRQLLTRTGDGGGWQPPAVYQPCRAVDDPYSKSPVCSEPE